MRNLRIFASIFALCFSVLAFGSNKATLQKPLTAAESSNYTRTSTYADVMNFIEKLQLMTDKIRVETIFETIEGRQVPLVIVADPMVTSAVLAHEDPRPIIYVEGNIHAGEVEGKESVLMLMRDMTIGPLKNLLKKNIYLFVPIFNADGNDKISPEHRNYMPNPIGGVGVRQNSQNYDLNRDYIKTDSKEVRAILKKVLIPWDPLIYVDLHTTDGSFHQETVTYLSSRGPNWDSGISNFIWNKLYPSLTKILRKKGIKTCPYGNFYNRLDPTKGWAPYEPTPRIGIDYMALRNRFSILVENYAYASFKTRVKHCYAFLKALFEFSASHSKVMKFLAKEADLKAAQNALTPPTQRKPFCLETERKPFKKPIEIKGYKYKKIIDSMGRPKLKPILDKKKTYKIRYWGNFICRKARPLPWGYFMAPGCDYAAKQLIRHGIDVYRLVIPIELESEQYIVDSLKVEQWVYQGHSRLNVIGQWQVKKLKADKGWFFIPMNQPLAHLIAFLMEPDSMDSLVRWNFFNNWVTREWTRKLPPLPIYRVMNKVNIVTTKVHATDIK